MAKIKGSEVIVPVEILNDTRRDNSFNSTNAAWLMERKYGIYEEQWCLVCGCQNNWGHQDGTPHQKKWSVNANDLKRLVFPGDLFTGGGLRFKEPPPLAIMDGLPDEAAQAAPAAPPLPPGPPPTAPAPPGPPPAPGLSAPPGPPPAAPAPLYHHLIADRQPQSVQLLFQLLQLLFRLLQLLQLARP